MQVPLEMDWIRLEKKTDFFFVTDGRIQSFQTEFACVYDMINIFVNYIISYL